MKKELFYKLNVDRTTKEPYITSVYGRKKTFEFLQQGKKEKITFYIEGNCKDGYTVTEEKTGLRADLKNFIYKLDDKIAEMQELLPSVSVSITKNAKWITIKNELVKKYEMGV